MHNFTNKQNEYKVTTRIDGGTYGSVFKAVHIPTQKEVAIKKIEITLNHPQTHRHLVMVCRELQILYKLAMLKDNFYTVRLLDAFVPQYAEQDPSTLDCLFLVTDFYEYDLNFLLDKGTNQLDENQAMTIIYNLLLAIKFIHSSGLIHRDLKPSNILLNQDCKVRLCDFGFSRSLITDENHQIIQKHKQRPLSPICFTRWYRPPEVILMKQYYD